jgi:hypothetical protein
MEAQKKRTRNTSQNTKHNGDKKQLNPYAKAPMPEKSIERYDMERNRIYTRVMDDHGCYMENGTSRILDKAKEKKMNPSSL